jgi:hypothetical protein
MPELKPFSRPARKKKPIQDFTGFNLKLSLGLGPDRFYAVLDLTHVHAWIHCTGKRYFRTLDDAE